MDPRRVAVRENSGRRLSRRATVLALAGLLFLGVIGPALAVVLVEQIDRYRSGALPGHGPGQEWGSAAVDGAVGAANKAQPASLQSQFPPIKGQDAPVAKANAAKVDGAKSTAVRGFDAATSKELADRRTEHTRTFTNADGTETTELSQEALNHRKPDGSWDRVDPTLVPADQGWRNASDSVDVRLAPRGDAAPLVRMSLEGDHEFGFSLRGAAASAGQVKGTEITYPAVQPRVDLRFSTRAGAVKETIVLHSADTPRTFEFPLHLKGLTAKVVDGRIELTGRDGQRHAVVPAGYMEDSSDGPAGAALSNGVKYELAGQTLRVTLDDAWLRDPARKFPVLVDPTVTRSESTGSMFVQRNSPGSNFSVPNGDELKAGTVTEGGTRIHAATYLKLPDLSGLRHHKIFGASLAMTNFHSYSCNARAVSVHPVTVPWEPTTGHAYPGPAYGGELSSSSFAYGYIAPGTSKSHCPQSTAFVDLGVAGRDLVQRWANGEQANHGLTVRASESDDFGWKRFYGHATANKPALYITHTPYDAEYRIDRPVPNPPLVKGGQPGKIGITVTNRGSTTWTPGEYVLSYRQFASSGAPMVQVNDSAVLPRNVARGESVTLEAAIHPPAEWGEYTFEFSMHRKGHAYFVDEQIPPAALVVDFQNVLPVLVEQYPPNGYSSPTLRPTLWARGTDIDSGGAGLQYRFTVCDKAAPTWCVDSGYSTNQAWTVPLNALKWSKTYLWNAFIKDAGGAESQPVTGSALLTAVPQPEITSHLGNAPYGSNTGDVDAQVGNYRTSAVDVSVGTAGPALALSRTYNSLDPRRDLAFGAGWTTQYDMRVVPDQDGSDNVVVTYPDGQQVRFGHNGGGTYASPPGRYATMFRNADNGWTLVDKNATGYYFRDNGRLYRITDSSSRATELSYDANGKLTTVRSPISGRSLTFTWAGAHVDTVRTDTNQTWRYTYEGDKLKQVCDPKNNCSKYEYGTGSHYRTSVLDARPESYWTLGETDGDKAASQIQVNLAKDTATYMDVQRGKPGIAAGSPDTAVGFDGVKSQVTLPESAIRKNRNVSIELWFKTTKAGPLIAFQNKVFDQSPTGAVPALYVGTDGKLRGQFWTDRNPPSSPITTSGTVNDGQWHHAVLSADVSSQTMYLDGAKVGDFAGTVDNLNLPYGQLGAGYAFGPADWAGWTNAERWYFEGEIDEVAIYAHPLGLNQAQAHYSARASSDQIIKATLPSGRTSAQLKYDTVRDRAAEYIDGNGGTWRFGSPHITGNDLNLVRTVRVTDPGNRNHYYDFDPLRGRILRYLSPLGVDTRKEDRPPASTTPPPPTTSTCSTQPDGSFCDVPIKDGSGFVDVEFQGVRGFGYDETGFQTTITDETGRQVELTHDDRGNVKQRRTCRAAANCQVAHYAYFLDPQNATDPRNDKLLEHRDARSASATDNTYRTSYAYDAQGHLLTQTTPDGAVVRHAYTDGNTPAADSGNEPKGLVKTSWDARNAKTEYQYYRNGDLASVRAPSGMRTVFEYDALGRKKNSKVISDAHPLGLLTTFEYDELSRLKRTVAPGTVNAVTGTTHTRRTDIEYDADGRQVRIASADATGGDAERVTTMVYDGHGRVERITDAEGGETSLGYDVFGNKTSMVNPNGVRYEFAYTARNVVSEVRLRGWNGDPSGAPELPNGYLVVSSNAYDRAGRLVRTTDAMQRTETREYYDDDLLKVRTQVGFGAQPKKIELERNVYDAAGNLTEQKLAGGLLRKFEYDATGRTKTATDDPAGLLRRTAFAYDLNGNVTQVTRTGNESNTGVTDSGVAEIVDYGYDAFSRRTSEEVRLGSNKLITKWTHDQRGLVTTMISARGNETGADPAAFTTSYGYDTHGQLTSVTAPPVPVETDGADPVVSRPVTKTGYNAFGEVVQSRDANGHVRRSDVDKLGRAIRSFSPAYTAPGQTQPVTGSTSVSYDRLGNVLERTDPRGLVTKYRYDQLNRPVEVEDADGVWQHTYTRAGELLSTVDPTGGRTESTYDEFGRKATDSVLERYPASTLTSTYAYDDAGRIVESKAPSNATTTFAYDAVGSMIRTTDPASVTTQFGYDLAGRQVRTADALGRTVRSGYDQAGRLASQRTLAPSGALLARSTFGYDTTGNLTAATDELNKATTYAYDALGRLSRQVEPVTDTSSITTTFGYDAAGNRTRLTDGRTNKTVYTYNSLGLPESTIEPSTTAHPLSGDRTWTTTYNAAGDPVSLRAPGGVVRDRTFDPFGRLTRETGSGAEASTTERVLEYDDLGRLTGASAVGGKNVYSYNDRGLLLSANGPGGDATREYNADGQLLTRTDVSGTTRLTYDKARVKTVQDGVTGVTQTVGYDNAGAVARLDYGGGRARTFGYDDFGRLATDTVGAASIGYGYDAKGQLKTKTVTGMAGAGQNTYGYDHASRLTSWTSPSGTVTYGWDASGNRTSVGAKESTYDERNRQRTDGAQVFTYSPRGTRSGSTYSFDAFDRMVRQGSANYAYDGFDRIGTRNGASFRYNGTSGAVVSDGQASFSRGAGDELLGIGQGADKRLAVSDRHGDLVGTLDAAGAVADSVSYDPFGVVVASSGTRRSIGFQGSWTDPDSGEVNMAARWYSPGSGGFVSRDSYTLSPSPSGMANRYSYGVGSPLNYADPTGHIPDDRCVGGPGSCGLPDTDGFRWYYFLCQAMPGLCGSDSEQTPPPPPPPYQPPPPPRDTNKRKNDGGRQHSDPSQHARQQARDHGKRNPLSVPQALQQPLYGNDRTPPVSSSPQMPSHRAGDFANPVDDINKSYAMLQANLVEQNGPIVQSISASLRSPLFLTDEPNSDTSWEADLYEKCLSMDTGGLPLDMQLQCFNENFEGAIPPGTRLTDDCGGGWSCLWGEFAKMGELLFGFTTASDAIDCHNDPGAIPCIAAGMGVLGPIGKLGGEGLKLGAKAVEGLLGLGKIPTKTTRLGEIPVTKIEDLADHGLVHSFDRHAEQWFGRKVPKDTHLGQWKDLLERGVQSKQVIPWSSGSAQTYAYVNRVDGKYFVVQVDRQSGAVVTAFVPNNDQLSAMLKLLGK